MSDISNLLIIIVTILTLAISAFYAYAKYRLSYWSRRGVKSFPTHLLFGNFEDTFTFKKSPGQVIQEIYAKASPDDPYIGFYIFHEPKLLLRDLSLMKHLMIKEFDVFPNRNFGGESQKDSVGLVSLLGIHQPRWKYLRQKLSPTLTGLKLRKMIPLINSCATPMLQFIGKAKDQSDGWKRLEFKDIFSRYATDVIASLAFGVSTNSFDKNDVAFYEAGQKIITGFKRGIILIITFFIPGLVRFIEPLMVGPAKYFRYIFWESMNARIKEDVPRGDLIDHFISLKNGEQRPDYKFEGDNLLAQAISYYVAGFEATSTAIAFSLYELSRHPEDEKRAYKEIMEVAGDKEIDIDLLNKMTFLDQVVNESLRMYPPLPIVDRVPVKDYKLPGSDLVIEKGTTVYVSVNGTNRDPRYFERPDEFFTMRPRNETEDLPSSSLSFGMGPRACVGQRLGLIMAKMALIRILKEYTLTNDIKGETVLTATTVFTQSISGLNIKLKKRS